MNRADPVIVDKNLEKMFDSLKIVIEKRIEMRIQLVVMVEGVAMAVEVDEKCCRHHWVCEQ